MMFKKTYITPQTAQIFTYPDGITHQAGTSWCYDDVVVINECVRINQDLNTNDIILNLPYFDTAYAYGVICQRSNGVNTFSPCVCQNGVIKVEGEIKTKNGLYPVIMLTTRKM